MNSKFHESFYSFAKYYDIAFDFRDVPKECRFFEAVFAKHSKRAPSSYIEFGAGPASHCLEMAKQMQQVTAVDLSQEMVDYGLRKASNASVQIKYDCADMISYRSPERYDLATLLMSSCSYLLTNEQMIEHLQSVAECLNLGGIYILEMDHPKSVFNITASTVNEWEMQRDGATVKMKWGAAEDKFDPITQITEVSVRLEYEDSEHKGVSLDCAPQRCFTATEFAALVAASQTFEIVEWYGAMDLEISFSNDKKAWRMIPVLRKI
jgi:SAM-dependent methyltransferase